MRAMSAIVLAATFVVTAFPATAQNSDAAAGNQAVASADQSSKPAKSKKAAKPAGDKICKRLSQGKVCLTAEQWKAYEEVM